MSRLGREIGNLPRFEKQGAANKAADQAEGAAGENRISPSWVSACFQTVFNGGMSLCRAR